MDNYAYIIAGLPDLRLEDERTGSFSAEDLIKEIRGLLSARDEAVLDLLLEGCDPEKLNADFYQKALQHGNRFIRDWFRFDLDLRNTVVSYLNDSLGRPEEEDMVLLEGRETEEFFELDAAKAVLNGADILKREQGLDNLRWQKIDELTMLDSLDLEILLGYVLKVKIIDRWMQLDPESGRALFRKLVDDIRSTYDNKKQNLTI
jgi:Protein of unknown function (DUF2764).